MSASETVSFRKLISLASGTDKLLMVLGHLFAIGSGIGPQSAVVMWGRVVDSFDFQVEDEEGMRIVERQALYWVIIGFALFIGCYVFQTLLF